MNVNVNFFIKLPEDVLHLYLLEKDFVISFSKKYKFYYYIIRPLLPLKLRKILQNLLQSRIACKDNFINEEFVEIVVSDNNFDKKSRNILLGSNKSIIILTHDVEDEKGFKYIPVLLSLEEKYGFKSSWNIVPYKYTIDDGILQLIRENGHEIGIHGYNHDGKLYCSEKTFKKRVHFINIALKKYGAVGFRSPMVHRDLRWLQELDIEYDASCFDYDPYQPFPGGTGSIWPFLVGKFVEMPYTLPQDHVLFYMLKEKNINIWKKKAEWIMKNKGMMLMLTHPDYMLENGHIYFYEEFLKYLSSLEGVQRFLPRDYARLYKMKVV